MSRPARKLEMLACSAKSPLRRPADSRFTRNTEYPMAMSTRSRNIIVGIVVLVGLAIAMWMVLLFAGRLAKYFAAPGLPVTFTTDRADGVSDGSSIFYLGMNVGRVLDLHRSPDNKTVTIDAEVKKDPPLPANLHGVIRQQNAFGGVSVIDLQLDGQPTGALASGATLPAEFEGSGLLPKQFTQLAETIQRQQLIQHMDEMVVNIRDRAEQARETLTSVQNIVGDPDLRENLRQSLLHIRETTENATKVSQDMRAFTGDLRHVGVQTDAAMSDVRLAAARLGTTLDKFESIANKVDQGKGTAGLLVNDPKLYQGLVDTTKELNLTIKDLQRVVLQWEQEGVTLKLGK